LWRCSFGVREEGIPEEKRENIVIFVCVWCDSSIVIFLLFVLFCFFWFEGEEWNSKGMESEMSEWIKPFILLSFSPFWPSFSKSMNLQINETRSLFFALFFFFLFFISFINKNTNQ
jgi:hypothetical protein